MRILKLIIIDDDIETIKTFEQFEKENSVLLTIVDIKSDTTLLIDSII